MRVAALSGFVFFTFVAAVVAQTLPLPGQPGYGERMPAPTPYDRDALYPTPLTIYGLFNAGLRKRDHLPQRLERDPCSGASSTPARLGIDSVERSRIGFRATEVLSSGQLAHMNLEQSLMLDTGELLGPCRLAFDARATVGLSDRRWGRVDLGRIEQVAWLLAQRTDPWRSNGTASPTWRMYVIPERGTTRSSGAVTYTSPTEFPWRASVQVGRPLLSDPNSHGWGASLAWDRLPWLVGAGWQDWNGGSWALPLVVAHDSGTLRLGATLTTGRVEGTGYRNLFLGVSAPFMSKGDPNRQEWRAGINLHRVDGGSFGDWHSDTKLGVGWRYRFSRRSWIAIGGGLVMPREGASRTVFDSSLTYSFERDLRVPQWPK